MAITGACSFLGRNLIHRLEESEKIERIVLLDIQAPPFSRLRKTRFYHVDLTDPRVPPRISEILCAEQVGVLFHLAFFAGPNPDESWAHEVESVGTMQLLHGCRESLVRQVVMASSTLLYGAHPSNPALFVESHPLKGVRGRRVAFIDDKIQSEEELARFAEARPEVKAVVLRFAPIIGPRIRTFVTRWLARKRVPTLLGFDPIVQFLHELDAIRALLCTLAFCPKENAGKRFYAFNIVGKGFLPLSKAIRLAGRRPLPMPEGILRRLIRVGWMLGWSEAPPAFVDYLRYSCLADGSLAERELGFVPLFSVKEALLDFGSALRLEEARLIPLFR
ncbi:MAG: NAD-dependent epimerase/dehydratase family protein [Sandaracinaceae bacterium]|nr:NAD-dependent epimerase/dehydratase family protein [Sandaracinaceae bacterium]MDW8245767.1 NAD-dependent epimerase/dehydratase family protein [Sandaracinaceae bacterium]